MEINKIFEMLIENESTSKKIINMVPSENFSSLISRIPMVSDGYNRYFFNANEDPKGWDFRGAQDIYKMKQRYVYQF